MTVDVMRPSKATASPVPFVYSAYQLKGERKERPMNEQQSQQTAQAEASATSESPRWGKLPEMSAWRSWRRALQSGARSPQRLAVIRPSTRDAAPSTG
jgi:hypothetical protein